MKKNYDLIQLNYGYLSVDEYLDFQKFINNGVVGIGEVTERKLEEEIPNILINQFHDHNTRKYFKTTLPPDTDKKTVDALEYINYLKDRIEERKKEGKN